MHLELVNGIRITPDGATVPNRRIEVGEDGRVCGLDIFSGDGAPSSGPAPLTVDLPGHVVVLPGLINAHDHLIGTFQPRVGRGPYVNWLEWDRDLKRSETFRERNQIDPDVIYRLSALKCIMSGVTTVADHIPHHLNAPHIGSLSVHVLERYCLAHSVASFRLDWGEGIDAEYELARREDVPFMVHAGEGFDRETRGELGVLHGMGCLGPHTVLIHGVGFSPADIDRVAGSGAHLVWCPGSNLFMFDVTADVRAMLGAGVNLSLGTDSLLSGCGGLLDELKLARSAYRSRYGEELPAKTLLAMATTNPARALRLEAEVGAIREGCRADILCVEGGEGDPFEAVVAARPEHIYLLLGGGLPLLGRESHLPLFEAAGRSFSRVEVKGGDDAGQVRLVADRPLDLLADVRARLGYHKELPFLPLESPDGVPGK